jgi:hypothetical protein
LNFLSETTRRATTFCGGGKVFFFCPGVARDNFHQLLRPGPSNPISGNYGKSFFFIIYASVEPWKGFFVVGELIEWLSGEGENFFASSTSAGPVKQL